MALREILAKFGFQFDQRGLAKADRSIEGVIGKLHTFGTVLAGSLIVQGTARFVKDIVGMGDNLGKTSTQLGISVEQLQQWRSAAGFAGVESSQFDQSMRVLQKNTVLAADGSKQSADAFNKLGVEIKDTNGNLKTGDQLMREVGLALGGLENSTERVALAQILMGRSGAKLLPLFKDGEEGLAALQRRFEEFGGPVGSDFVKMAEDTKDIWQDFDTATTVLKSNLAVNLLPILNAVTIGISKTIAWFSKATKNTHLLQAVMVALGYALQRLFIAKFGKDLLNLARQAALPLIKFALLVLVIDDLITLFRGGKSAIGSFLDSFLGEGASATFVKEIKSIGGALKDLIVNFGEVNISADGFVTDNETRFTRLASSLASSTDQIVQDFAEAWELAKQDLSAFVDDSWEAAKEIGVAFIDGIAQAIKDGASALVAAVKALGDEVVDGAKKVFKINSPSRLTGDEIGDPIIEGIEVRMLEGIQRIKRMFPAGLNAALSVNSASTPVPAASGSRAPASTGGIIFKTEINMQVSGSVDKQGIDRMRSGLRQDLDTNRRATLEALKQVVEVP